METAAHKIIGCVILILSLLAALFTGGYAAGKHYTNAEWQVRWEKRNADDKESQRLAAERDLQESERIRQREYASAQQSQANIAELQQRLDDAKSRENDLLGDYKRGIMRLRQQFRCGLSQAASAVQDAKAVAGSDATARCGLSGADVEFLIRFARSANEVSSKLRAAQKELCNQYQAINGQKLDYKVCNDETTQPR